MGAIYNHREDRSQLDPEEAILEKGTRWGCTTVMTKGTGLNDPAVSAERGDLRWTDSHNLEDPPNLTPRTKPPIAPVKTSIQGRREMALPNKDRTGLTGKSTPANHGYMRTHEPDRTPRGGREPRGNDGIRTYSLKIPYGHGENTEYETDSAWGARGHMVQSADSVDEGSEARFQRVLDSRNANHESKPDEALGGIDCGEEGTAPRGTSR